MTASAGGRIDAIVFTGGVGEHAPEVRAAATEDLPVGEVLVIEAREDLEIVADLGRSARRQVSRRSGRGPAS